LFAFIGNKFAYLGHQCLLKSGKIGNYFFAKALAMGILYLYKRKSISQNVILWVNLYGAEKVTNSKYKVC